MNVIAIPLWFWRCTLALTEFVSPSWGMDKKVIVRIVPTFGDSLPVASTKTPPILKSRVLNRRLPPPG